MKNIELSAFRWGIIAPLTVIYVIATLWIMLLQNPGNFSFPTTTFAGLFSYYFIGSWLLTGNKKIPETKALIFLNIFAVLFLLFSLGAFRFLAVTGTSLDFHLVYFTLSNFREVAKVAASESSSMMYVIAVDLALILIALPWILRKNFRREYESNLNSMEATPHQKRNHKALYLGCIGLIGTTVSAAGGGTTSFMQNSWLQAMLNSDSPFTEELSYLERSFSATGILEKKSNFEAVSPRNVAVVILESVGSSATTLHDPNLPTTPFLSRIAKTSVVANNTFAVVPHTSKALVAILCGLEPNLKMEITEASHGVPINCLPKLLDKAGYKTAFFQSATSAFENREQLVKNMGFDNFTSVESMNKEGHETVNYFGYDDRIMLAPSKQWLELMKQSESPFLATYLTVSPHHDYQNRQRNPELSRFSLSSEHERYLNAVSIVDSFSEDLLQQYKDLGFYENTVFIFIGDHGEAFGQHGRFQHDNVLWNEVLQVPLIIHIPWAREPVTIMENVSQIDLLPTIVSLLGYQIEGEQYPGHDILQPIPYRKLFAGCWYRFRCIAAIDENLKFIEHYSWMNPELFDMQSDPFERNNLWQELDPMLQDKYRKEVFLWKRQVEDAHDLLTQ